MVSHEEATTQRHEIISGGNPNTVVRRRAGIGGSVLSARDHVRQNNLQLRLE